MEHYIYKITNNINGKYYYGKRSCKGLAIEDLYMGSGVNLKRAIKKYGIENFTKEICAYCDSSSDALELEELVVTQFEVDDPMCYNMKTGGMGGEQAAAIHAKIAVANKGKIRSEETRAKISEAARNRSAETKAKISEANKGKKRSAETRAKLSAAGKARTHSEETRAKISEAARNRSAETRAKMAEAKRNITAETRAKISEAHKGKTYSAETRAKMSASQQNRRATEMLN